MFKELEKFCLTETTEQHLPLSIWNTLYKIETDRLEHNFKYANLRSFVNSQKSLASEKFLMPSRNPIKWNYQVSFLHYFGYEDIYRKN